MASTGKEHGVKGAGAKLAQAAARLAFWRKPVDVDVESAVADQPLTPSKAPLTDSSPAEPIPAVQPGWLARVASKLRRNKSVAAESASADALIQAAVVAAEPVLITNPPAPEVIPPPVADAPAMDLFEPNDLSEMLELADPITPSIPPGDMLLSDDTPEALLAQAFSDQAASAALQSAEAAFEDELAAQADMGQPELMLDEAEPMEAEPAEAAAPDVPQAVTHTVAAGSAPVADASPVNPDDTPKVSLKARLFGALTQKWGRATQAAAADSAPVADASPVNPDDTPKVSLKAQLFGALTQKWGRATQAEVLDSAPVADAIPTDPDETPETSETPRVSLKARLLGALTQKWVWIPSVSVAVLAVVGTLSFMLMQSTQATHELQAELASAKKQLKQAPITPQVIPPVLVAHQNAAPHESEPASPLAESGAYAESGSYAAAAPGANDALDCDISDKASVAQNLKSCIEAFNRATAR
ncbi:MAG TPA: hypothetical protein VIN38_07355 [Thiobacillus sp.]